jgi:hypothetical protein
MPPVSPNITDVAPQIDLNKGKSVGVSVAAGTLVKDEGSELIRWKQ